MAVANFCFGECRREHANTGSQVGEPDRRAPFWRQPDRREQEDATAEHRADAERDNRR